MSSGVPVNRQWVIVLSDGTPVVEWGDGTGVNLYSGEIVHFDQSDYSHAIQDIELENLKKSGHILSYDQHQVYVSSLPEFPQNPLR